MYVDVVGSLVVIFQQTPRVERLQGCRFKMTEDTSTYHSERQSTELNTHFPSYRSWSPIRRWRCTYSNSAVYLLAEQITFCVLAEAKGAPSTVPMGLELTFHHVNLALPPVLSRPKSSGASTKSRTRG